VIRFESLGLISGLSKEAIHSQLKTALNYVIHIEKVSQGKRKVVGIGEFKVDEKENLFVEEIVL
jgi:Flp pilus assembly CpaF family ATPase